MRKLCLTLAAFFFSLMLVLPVHAAQVYSDGFFQYHAYEGYNSICGYFGSETTVTVPSSIAGRPVSRIEAGAFDGCSTIEKLVLPDTIMEIEEGAFSGAKNLATIEDASGVWDRKKAESGDGGSTDDSRSVGGNGGSSNNPGGGSTGNAGINNGNPGGSGEGSPIGDYEYIEPEKDGQAESGEQTPESGETDTGKVDESQKDDGENSESGVFCLILWIILAATAVVVVVTVVFIRRKMK